MRMRTARAIIRFAVQLNYTEISTEIHPSAASYDRPRLFAC